MHIPPEWDIHSFCKRDRAHIKFLYVNKVCALFLFTYVEYTDKTLVFLRFFYQQLLNDNILISSLVLSFLNNVFFLQQLYKCYKQVLKC